jgi:hypothetical protein
VNLAPNLSPITTPRPKHKMKTFNWSKLPPQALNCELTDFFSFKLSDGLNRHGLNYDEGFQ